MRLFLIFVHFKNLGAEFYTSSASDTAFFIENNLLPHVFSFFLAICSVRYFPESTILGVTTPKRTVRLSPQIVFFQVIQHPVKLFMPACPDFFDLDPLETIRHLSLPSLRNLFFSDGK